MEVGQSVEVGQPYARDQVRRRIPPRSSRTGRERVGSSTTTGPLTRSREDTEGRLRRGVPVSRVHGQDLGLRRLWTGVRIHRERTGLLRSAGLFRPETMQSVPKRAEGVATGGRLQPWRWTRRRVRPRAARDVRRHMQQMREVNRGSVPPHERQARLLQRLLPERPEQLAAGLQPARRPGPAARVVSCSAPRRPYPVRLPLFRSTLKMPG